MATPFQPPCIELVHFSAKDETPAVAFVRWRQAPEVLAERWRTHWHPVCDPHIPDDPAALVAYLDGRQPAADHPGHVHVRYAGNISADHPTDI